MQYESPQAPVKPASIHLASLLEPNTVRRVEYRRRAQQLVSLIIQRMEARELGIVEGRVSSMRPNYRRLDCDGRCLVYLRTRASIHAVRADVPPSWLRVEPCRLTVATTNRGLSAALMVHDEKDVDVFLEFLIQTVAETRAAMVRAMRAPNWTPWWGG